MGVPRRLNELIGGDFLPATGSLQVHFEKPGIAGTGPAP